MSAAIIHWFFRSIFAVGRWRLAFVIGMGVLSVFVCTRHWPRIRSGGQTPRLLLREGHHDFGNVLPGQRLEFAFELVNTGTRDLKLTNLNTSCGCAPAEITEDTVRPGSKSWVKIAFRPPERNGVIAHRVSFSTNDPLKKEVQLTVCADAHWPFTVEPPSVHIPALLRNASIERELHLSSFDGSPFSCDRIDVSNPQISVLATLDQTSRVHLAKVTVNGNRDVGTFEESVKFWVVSPTGAHATLTVPVVGTIVSQDFRISPSTIRLGMQESNAEVERKILLRSAQPMEIESVVLGEGQWHLVEYAHSSNSEELTMIITVKLRVPEISGYQATYLAIRSPTYEDPVEVPVSCFVR